MYVYKKIKYIYIYIYRNSKHEWIYNKDFAIAYIRQFHLSDFLLLHYKG